MAYLIVFFLTTIFIYKNENRSTFKGVLFAVVILSAFAGVRSINIGSDTAGYPLEVFNLAKDNKSFEDLYSDAILFIYMKEYGYVLLVYLISQLFDSFNWFLFFTSLIVNAGVGLFLYNFKKNNINIPLWLCWLSYCCLMYNHTLALSKQPIAISFCLVSYIYYTHKKYIYTILLFLVALSFHFTSAIFLLVYLILKIKSTKLRLLLVCATLATSFGSGSVITAFTSLQPEYLSRFDSYVSNNDGDLAVFEVLFKTSLVIISYIIIKKYTQICDNDLLRDLFYLLIFEISLFCIGALSAQAGRLSFYIYPFFFVAIPYIISYSEKRNFLYLLYSTYLLLFWVITIVIQGSTHSFPYESIL